MRRISSENSEVFLEETLAGIPTRNPGGFLQGTAGRFLKELLQFTKGTSEKCLQGTRVFLEGI